MFRYFALRKDPETGVGVADIAWVLDMVRAVGLVVVIVTVSVSDPGPATSGGRGTAIAVTLGLSAAAWLVWLLAGQRRPPLATAGLIGMALAGGVLAGLAPDSPAVVIGCMTAVSAAVRLRLGLSFVIVAKLVLAFLLAGLFTGAPTGTLLGYPFAYLGLWTLGLTRREYLARAEQAERMLAQTQRAREAETQAAALAERARIARDIHDVLAHSLAAVSVNLQAAEGLLGSATLPADHPELAKAMECIGRAGTLTREGMAATRRAVLALREDAAPLPDQLSSLASHYGVAGEHAVSFSISGDVRPLAEAASLAAYRTAQEALTNARKHAPGQPVSLGLDFDPGGVTVRVVNPLPPEDAAAPLSGTGAGYGLAGMRERAELVGGTVEAGPADGSWRVTLRIPV